MGKNKHTAGKIRPDLLQVTVQGIQGRQQRTTRQGNCRLIVSKGYNEPENSIWVDVYTGQGINYSQAETALINISFADGTQWNGTFDKLKAAINKATHQ